MGANQIRREGSRRTRQLHVRTDEETMQMMQRVAKARGRSVSRTTVDLFRQADGRRTMEERERKSPVVEELERIRTEIWRIGHNINQIARMVNQELGATTADVAASRMNLDRCEAMLDEIRRIVERESGTGAQK